MQRRQALHRGLRFGLAMAGVGLTACATPPAAAPDFVRTIAQAAPAVVGIGDGQVVLGSGFRVAGRPWIVTAAHVVHSVRGAPVVTWSSRPLLSSVLHIDDEADLALLDIDADSPMPGLTLQADEAPAPLAGQWIVVLGRPFGAEPTAGVGVISAAPGAVLEPAALRGRLQLNAAVNPGNSGGPVTDLQGRVIGIANATVPGGYGIGFAVPVSALRRLMTAAENKNATP